MTPDQSARVLREIRGLEKLALVIRATLASSDEWGFALVAIADRIRLLRVCVGLNQDPRLVDPPIHADGLDVPTRTVH